MAKKTGTPAYRKQTLGEDLLEMGEIFLEGGRKDHNTDTSRDADADNEQNSDLEELIDVIKAMQTLAKSHGIVITFSIPASKPPLATEERLPPLEPQDLREDLMWLQRKFLDNPSLQNNYSGNYVAVRSKEIIAVGKTASLTCASALHALGLERQISDMFLLIPINVTDQDAEEIWQEAQMKCGVA